MRFAFIAQQVVAWANERELITKGDPKTQCLKTVSEVGELADAIIKGEDPVDALGDVVVTLIILARQLGLDLPDCLAAAYNEIKDRTGKLVDGNFVKDEH